MTEERDKWHDFPETQRAQLNAIYSSIFLKGYTAVTCPCCNEGAIAVYWWPYPNGEQLQGHRKGGSWMWCNACYGYEHASALVPSWWPENDPLAESGVTLYHAPLELAAHWPEILGSIGS